MLPHLPQVVAILCQTLGNSKVEVPFQKMLYALSKSLMEQARCVLSSILSLCTWLSCLR